MSFMSNSFQFSDDNKRYHTLSYHLKKTFGGRVFKAVIDAGLVCPHAATGGCTYCVENGSEFSHSSSLSITEQLQLERERIYSKYGEVGLIAYFQAGTNTNAPFERLKQLYEEALSCDGVVGLSIATRPDCISQELYPYFEELAKRTYLTVELGLQSSHNSTLARINRGHTVECFCEAHQQLKACGVRTCVHLINGLPSETESDMLATAQFVAKQAPSAVKLHLLHIMEGTVLAEQYQRGEFEALSQEKYVRIVCEQLRFFSPDVVIERITGDGSKQRLIAPKWSLNKLQVLADIDKYLQINNIYQGINL
jgi:radical SAM protein (TIGR01212 family)